MLPPKRRRSFSGSAAAAAVDDDDPERERGGGHKAKLRLGLHVFAIVLDPLDRDEDGTSHELPGAMTENAVVARHEKKASLTTLANGKHRDRCQYGYGARGMGHGTRPLSTDATKDLKH